MAEDTETLRRDIEQTRRHLGQDVDALTDKVDPRRVMHRRTDAARHRLTTLRERVMGTGGQMKDSAASTASSVQEAGSKLAQAVEGAPDQARDRTRGAPLAVGVVAFAAGWVVAAALPPTAKERELAERTKEKVGGPVAERVSEAAHEVADELRGPAQEAVENVRESATEAVSEVKEEGRAAAEDVKGQTQESAESVRRTT